MRIKVIRCTNVREAMAEMRKIEQMPEAFRPIEMVKMLQKLPHRVMGFLREEDEIIVNHYGDPIGSLVPGDMFLPEDEPIIYH